MGLQTGSRGSQEASDSALLSPTIGLANAVRCRLSQAAAWWYGPFEYCDWSRTGEGHAAQREALIV